MSGWRIPANFSNTTNINYPDEEGVKELGDLLRNAMAPKRDRQGNPVANPSSPDLAVHAKSMASQKKTPQAASKPTTQFASIFEGFRTELDEHYDRRERLTKASRDITALSKKMIFSLQRVRNVNQPLPAHIEKEISSRLSEISALLRTMAPDVQGINRYRYARTLMCLEELVEALTFAHYLRTTKLAGLDDLQLRVDELVGDRVPAEGEAEKPIQQPVPSQTSAPCQGEDQQSLQDLQPLRISLTEEDYLMGIFDLSGEIMRFATTNRKLASAADMQGLGTLFEILLPPSRLREKAYAKKMEVLRSNVQKVENVAYGLAVRGGERPDGWMPEEERDGGGGGRAEGE